MLPVKSFTKIWRHMVGIEHAANNNRLVGIASLKRHDHFVSDTGNVSRSPSFSGPECCHANPTGAVLIIFPLTIPMELHFHPAILVGENLFPFRPNNDGSLCPLDKRFGRFPYRAERERQRNRGE